MKTRIGTDVSLAARLLQAGELVAFGTETVYGLGADATNAEAVARIFEAKGRPRFDPLIVHVADPRSARCWTTEWPADAEQLAERFWPGPLTMVLPKSPEIADLVTSGLPTVGVRVPGEPMTRSLLTEAGCPVAAPSANLFGRMSPTKAAHVVEQLDGRVAYVLDTGPCRVGVESTVVRVNKSGVTLLRPGGVTVDQLNSVCKSVSIASDTEKGEMLSPDSPGQLPQHYAPSVPLRLGRPTTALPTSGLLAFGSDGTDWPGPVAILSASGDVVEAAANLFQAMRDLVDHGADLIFVDAIPETGIGLAINDRLRRAAASS